MEIREKQWVENFMAQIIAKNPNEPEFHQAVRDAVIDDGMHTGVQQEDFQRGTCRRVTGLIGFQGFKQMSEHSL